MLCGPQQPPMFENRRAQPPQVSKRTRRTGGGVPEYHEAGRDYGSSVFLLIAASGEWLGSRDCLEEP